MKGDLTGIVRARRLSRATMRNIKQNLFWAFAYNSVGVPIGDEAKVVGVFLKEGNRSNVIPGNGLGVDACKARVVLGIEGSHTAGGTRQEFVEAAGAHPVQGLMRKF